MQKAHDDEDMTLLLDKDFGFVVGFSLRFGNGPVAKDDYTPILKGVAADYDIVKGELWGAGDVGGEWQGILLKYKM